MRKPLPVLVDCDPALFTIGLDVDDDLALLFLLGSPEVDLLGVTTTAGNTLGSLAFRDAKKLLSLAGREDVPVKRGAGLFSRDTRPTDASRFLVESVRRRPGAVTLLAIGPPTNLAAAAEEDRFFEGNIGRLVIMGGRSVSGKSDFNFRCDSRAAARVLKFETRTPKTLISFDLGLGVAITREDVLRLSPSKNGPLRTLPSRLIRFARFQDRFRALRGRSPGEARGGFHPWDVIAAAWLVVPELFGDVRQVRASVDRRGRTIFDGPDVEETGGKVSMPGTVEAERFRELFLERIRKGCS